MKAAILTLWVCLCAAAILAAETNQAEVTTLTVDGVTYENVRWGTATPHSVTIYHKAGIARIPLDKLPSEHQNRFGYDPSKEAERRKQEQEKQQEAARNAKKQAEKRGEVDKKDGQDAYYAARRFVHNNLKSPSSAKFSNPRTDEETGWTKLNPGQFRCFGTVDAENAFGAKLRERWSVIIQTEGDKWRVVYCVIGSQIVLDTREQHKTAGLVSAESFLGMTKGQMVKALGQPVAVKRGPHSVDGAFTIYTYSEEKGRETFFTIWDSDGKIDNGMYQGTYFSK